MIEKLGHRKRVQTMRREWINEGKPKVTIEDTLISTTTNSIKASTTSKPDESSTSRDPAPRPRTPAADDTNDDDLYSATPKRPDHACLQSSAPGDSLFVSDDESSDHPPDDDLDLLLAEDSTKDTSMKPNTADNHNGIKKSLIREDNFDDEIEAMTGMDDMW